MDRHARRLLRQIALGVPLLVVGCETSYPPCPGPVAVRTFPVDAEERVRLGGPNRFQECQDLCVGLASGWIDAGALGDDADVPDAGIYWPYTSASCAVDGDAGHGTVTCTYSPTCIGGRAPAGLRACRPLEPGPGTWLARAAHLERASVSAFEELASELRRHGAPRRLVRAARHSADDERRHADAVAALARARGVTVPRVRRGSHRAMRPLAALAAENAIEGCARESYGALVAAWQATHAIDDDVRAAYASIARDEARHALLSAAIDDWARTRLPHAVTESIAVRRERAICTWRRSEIEDEATRSALGLPDADRRAAWLSIFARRGADA